MSSSVQTSVQRAVETQLSEPSEPQKPSANHSFDGDQNSAKPTRNSAKTGVTEVKPADDGASLNQSAVFDLEPFEQEPSNERALFAPMHWIGLIGSVATLLLMMPTLFFGAPSNSGATALIGAAMVAVLLHGLSYYAFARTERPMVGASLSVGVFMLALSWSCYQTGGMESALIVFFVLAPIEALLTRNMKCALGVSLAAGALFLASVYLFPGNTAFVHITEEAQLALNIMALLYALSLAARVAKLASIRDLEAVSSQRAIDQFHAVTHDVFAILRRDGSVERVFGAVGPVLHCAKRDLKGFGLLDRMHIADRPQFLTSVDEVHMRQKRATVEVRLRMGPSGRAQRFIWTEIDLSAITGLNKDREVYALVRDISDVKDHEAELTLAREKAEANDAAKGRFLATMSHELRTPLNAIIGFADILDEEVFEPLANDQQREYVGLIRESGGHLLQLVNDLLDMSKLEAGHFQIVAEPFAVRAIVDRCTRLMCQEINKRGQLLDVDIPTDLPELAADQRAFRQILINLLSNASKFTPQDGKITLRARRDGPMMVLSITDTGIGIAQADLKKIGQPFFQANGAYNRDHQGTGLGLSVVKGLCELHEGSLRVSSIEGEGTTVTIRLPVAGPSSENAHHDANEARTRASNATVLAKLEQSVPATLQTASSDQNQSNLGGTSKPIETPLNSDERLRAHG